MSAYYNEIDPKAAAWLRELIKAKLIADGEVDERSIEDIRPSELGGFAQCHFFAGIGGWSRALRIAGWPDDRPVWTGSCPCQSFSAAGKGKGFSDERHLWPAWFHLIGEREPPIIFGEQVDAAIKHGWLDLVQTDLEAAGYAVGHSVIPAAGVGAPHGRHRLWFVAQSQSQQNYGANAERLRWLESSDLRTDGGVVLANSDRRESRGEAAKADRHGGAIITAGSGVADTELSTSSRFRPVGVSVESEQETKRCGYADYWKTDEFVFCSDKRARPIKSGIHPLADGLPGRVQLLRGYGNAIVPQVAAAFIEAAT